jgi:hypothetical protein
LEFELTQATPDAVAQQLQSISGRGSAVRPWAELVTDGEYTGRLGEITKSSDWKEVPRNEPVRVVSLKINNRWVIRWATTSALLRAQHGLQHEYLYGDADPQDDIRSGYAMVTVDGQVKVDR